MKEITIWFDGGCKPNPGQKYGSYEVRVSDGDPISGTVDLGWGTNNEAEFESLIYALERAAVAAIDPSIYKVKIYTDSTVVMNRVSGKNRSRGSEPEKRMFALTASVHEFLKLFAEFTIHWQGREHNVARFGH